jgi:thiamine pyrophosphate-dependent acetolactate synthase large subunit-like protein
VYEVTGAQPTPGSAAGRSLGRSVDFAAIARGAGFASVYHFTTADEWDKQAESALGTTGPVFIWLDVRAVPGRAGPRSPGPAAERAQSFMQALGGTGVSR